MDAQAGKPSCFVSLQSALGYDWGNSSHRNYCTLKGVFMTTENEATGAVSATAKIPEPAKVPVAPVATPEESLTLQHTNWLLETLPHWCDSGWANEVRGR